MVKDNFKYLTKHGFKGEIRRQVLDHAEKGKFIAIFTRYTARDYFVYDTYGEAKNFLHNCHEYGECFAIGIICKEGYNHFKGI